MTGTTPAGSAGDAPGTAGRLSVGDRIPPSRGRTHHGEDLSLDQLAGAPSLVMFYPFAFSRVCGSELADVHAARQEIARLGARVVAISCDAVHTLRAYAEHLGLDDADRGLDLVSDFWPHGAVARACGAFDETRGAPTRTSFILDSDLVVRHVQQVPAHQSRDLQEALAELGRAA